MAQNSKRQSSRANRDNFYVFPIQSWDWNYSFGIPDFLPKPEEPSQDYRHFSWSSLQDTLAACPSEAFAEGTMVKFLSLGFVLAAATLGSGCISYSRTTRAVPAPAPAPAPVVQRTFYPDGTYVDQVVQPVPR